VPDDKATWRSYEPDEVPNWLRPSPRQALWVKLRVELHRSLGVSIPAYVAYQGAPTGPRRWLRSLKRSS